MDNKTPQYQRAVTPTIDNNVNSSGLVKGKVLNYTSTIRSKYPKQNVSSNSEKVAPALLPSSINSRGGTISPRPNNAFNISQPDMGIQGRATNARPLNSISNQNGSFKGTSDISNHISESLNSLSVLPRFDLIPLSDDIAADGVIFARIRNQPESLVVFRTPEERARNPERLNLDRRQLEMCPLLEQEQRLRLLNFQNNSIKAIHNLENLPNLIFLDLYNNKIASLDGPLSSVRGLRVLMAGKNKISTISNLNLLRKLDVLDLHSNEIRVVEGLEGLTDLRVLNLAGNRISMVDNLSSLQSLTELNLRRNCIESVTGLHKLPALQRVFLSHNQIRSIHDIACLFEVNYLIELSLDGNPLSEADPVRYRSQVVLGISGLRHLDLKRVTDEERSAAVHALPFDDRSNDILSLKKASQLFDFSGEQTGKSDEGFNVAVAGRLNVNGDSIKPDSTVSYPHSVGPPTSLDGAPNKPNTLPAPSILSSGLARDIFELDDAQEATSHTTDAKQLTGLASLARSGRLSATQSIFDLEIIGPDEKALIAVGDSWEWTQSRRLLLNVSEASLYHMRRDTILAKFTPSHVASLPALKSLRLVSNDFSSLSSLDFVAQLFGSSVQHLIIRDCPVNNTAGSLLRSYMIAAMPLLVTFNESEVTDEERQIQCAMFKPVLQLHQDGNPLFTKRAPVMPTDSGTNGTRFKVANSHRNASTVSKYRESQKGPHNKNTDSSSLALAESALYHRRVNNEFHSVFENVVKTILKETLESIANR